MSEIDFNDDEVMNEVRRLAVRYDRVALMISEELLPTEIFKKFHGDDLIAVWNKIGKPIDDWAQSKGRKSYCRSYKELVQRWTGPNYR